MNQDQAGGSEPVCLRCGRCCRYGMSINASLTDIRRWMAEGRSDILAYFEAYCTDGRYINCAGFLPDRGIPDILWTDLINPDTGGYYKDCPFLSLVSEHTWCCTIYQTRPAICIRFRPWEWGEKGVFFACPVVDRMKQDSSSGCGSPDHERCREKHEYK